MGDDAGVDVLVTDMVMPGLGGRELADRILDSAPGTAVVFISGYTDDQVGMTNENGSPQLLLKPFAPAALVAAITRALDRSVRAAHRS